MSRELLDLSTIVDRPTLRLRTKTNPGGKVYEILGPTEISLYEQAVLEMRSRSLSEMNLDKKPTPAQERAHRKALLDMVGIVAPSIETKALNELSDVQLLAIYGAYVGLIERSEGGDEGNAQGAQTSGASSPDSKRSTGETPRRGSTTRSGS